MLKVILDTPVFVSALLNPHGKAAQILNCIVKDGIRLFASPSITEERDRVLRYPKLAKRHGLKKTELEEFIADLPVITSLVEETREVLVVTEAPWSHKYLSCALSGRADLIISRDSLLLDLKEFEGVQITTPARVLELVAREL